MLKEPTALLVAFVRSISPGVFVSGDWIGRPEGVRAVIIDFEGGWRTVRDRMDRADFTLHVYGPDRDATSDLAYTLRDSVLSTLPGAVLSGVQVADIEELMIPTPTPDEASREPRYTFAVSMHVFEV